MSKLDKKVALEVGKYLADREDLGAVVMPVVDTPYDGCYVVFWSGGDYSWIYPEDIASWKLSKYPRVITKITRVGRTVNYLEVGGEKKIITSKEADRLVETGDAIPYIGGD